MAEWQPIETAPKDGTRILIYVPGQINDEPVNIASWEAYEAEGDHDNWAWVTELGEVFFSFKAWMPLPSPPEV